MLNTVPMMSKATAFGRLSMTVPLWIDAAGSMISGNRPSGR
jgi:hypothetical protein